jgi:hypothetical protein
MMSPSRRAQAVDASADLPLANKLLVQADRHLASAAIPGVDLDSRFGMLYDAARKGADAIMRAAGRRITQGVGHHIVFFEEAKRLLPAADSRLVARVEGARNIRNAIEYQAREVTQTEVDELTSAAAHFIAAARLYVEQHEAP